MKRCAAVFAIGLLAGCAPSIVNPVGQNLVKGVVSPSPSASAIRVGSKANILHQGKRLKFEVWIEADSSKGRLDALGPFGTPLATVIWDDSTWKAWLPGQATLLRGTGASVNLPVLDLKDIRPSSLVAPLLGRTLPAGGSVKTVTGENTTLVLPATPNPTWSILLNSSTGLASRKQTLQNGRETEGLNFHNWRREGDILVPGTIDRTTPDGQLLQLELQEWKSIPAVPIEHLQLRFQSPVDTITLSHNERGQTVFRIRAAGTNGQDTASVVVTGGQPMMDAPLDNGDETDSLQDVPEDSVELPDSADGDDVSEEQLMPALSDSASTPIAPRASTKSATLAEPPKSSSKKRPKR